MSTEVQVKRYEVKFDRTVYADEEGVIYIEAESADAAAEEAFGVLYDATPDYDYDILDGRPTGVVDVWISEVEEVAE